MLAKNQISLSVVLPCFNEVSNIDSVLSSLLTVQSQAASISDFEVIVVDDGSTDGSRQKLAEYAQKVKVVSLPENRGYGYALKVGIASARNDLVAFYDLDRTHDPNDVLKMCKAWRESTVDMIVGVRLNEDHEMPWLRLLGNKFYLWLMDLLFNESINDATSGMRLVKKSSIIPHVEHLPDGLNFTLALTLLALRKKLTFKNVPVKYFKRGGQSKLSVCRDGWVFFVTILRGRFFDPSTD